MHTDFDAWLAQLCAMKVCVCVGVAPQRVLWPAPPAHRFDCADYFRPQERLPPQQMSELVEFLSKHRPSGDEVDRGRYGFANYLKVMGPAFIREMPRGYLVELVQLLLDKNILLFRKGKVSFKPTAAVRWQRAVASATAAVAHSPSRILMSAVTVKAMRCRRWTRRRVPRLPPPAVKLPGVEQNILKPFGLLHLATLW